MSSDESFRMKRKREAETADASSCAINQQQSSRTFRTSLCALLALSVLVLSCLPSLAQKTTARDVSKESARTVRPWVRDGVVYEIFPRVFSAEGNFNGVTARLDELKTWA